MGNKRRNHLKLRQTATSHGDINKNEMLTFKELDDNFIFLKERDLKTLKLDGNNLVYETLGGDNFTVDMSSLGGGSSLWTENGNNIQFTTGNVGIGTNNPTEKLHVGGKSIIEGSDGSSLTLGTYNQFGTDNLMLRAKNSTWNGTVNNNISFRNESSELGDGTSYVAGRIGYYGTNHFLVQGSFPVDATYQKRETSTMRIYGDRFEFDNPVAPYTNDGVSLGMDSKRWYKIYMHTTSAFIDYGSAFRFQRGSNYSLVIDNADNVTIPNGDLNVSGTLNIGTLGAGTAVNNLGIDNSGNVVVGSSGGGSVTINDSVMWNTEGMAYYQMASSNEVTLYVENTYPAATSYAAVFKNKDNGQAYPNIGVKVEVDAISYDATGIHIIASATGANAYALRLEDGNQLAGRFLGTDANGNATWKDLPSNGGSSLWSENGTKIYYNTNNVGIGTSDPLSPLHLEGTTFIESSIRFLNNANSNNENYWLIGSRSFGGSDLDGFEIGRAGDSNGGKLYLRHDGNVGIGTYQPSQKLEVAGNVKISGTLNIGTLGAGTAVNNLGIDNSGNVVVGSTGGDSITNLSVGVHNGTSLEVVSSDGTNVVLPSVTTSLSGLMSNTDKTKLDSISTGAEVNQNTFSTIVVAGQSNIVADNKTDTLTLVEGSNITITTNSSSDEITISSTSSGGSSVWESGVGTESVQTINTTEPNTATGDYSLAGGNNCTSGDYSLSFGNDSSATGNYSIAVGNNNTSSGTYSVALGWNNVASGSSSTAFGRFTNSYGIGSFSVGWSTTAHAYGSTAIGRSTNAEGKYSFAGGIATRSIGDYSHSSGKGVSVGANEIQSGGIASFCHFFMDSTTGHKGAYADYSAILGGVSHIINSCLLYTSPSPRD